MKKPVSFSLGKDYGQGSSIYLDFLTFLQLICKLNTWHLQEMSIKETPRNTEGMFAKTVMSKSSKNTCLLLLSPIDARELIEFAKEHVNPLSVTRGTMFCSSIDIYIAQSHNGIRRRYLLKCLQGNLANVHL